MKIPTSPPSSSELFDAFAVNDLELLKALVNVGPLPRGKYLHWDELRHRQPPENLTAEQWWLGVKMARRHGLKSVPLRARDGSPFNYSLADPILRYLHEIDQNASGGIQLAEEVTNPGTRDRYIINSLIEESITSSQLEGASTTAEIARDMIRSGRKPIDRSETMILNNFVAMRYVQINRREPITPERIFELHRIVTDGTLDDPGKAGQFRTSEDNVQVTDPQGNVLHIPPEAHELAGRLELMCEFANSSKLEGGAFMHPVLKAVILHFWMGYDHPFVDGNGRTARALFYWSMLADSYWLAEYISISRILKKAPSQYGRAFLFTETDENDLTYFALYQLDVICRAIDELKEYLRKKMMELREVQTLLKRSADLNHRQLALVTHALRHPGRQYTVHSHMTSHNVVPGTARADLLNLTKRRLLHKRKVGKSFVFTAASDLVDRLSAKSAQRT